MPYNIFFDQGFYGDRELCNFPPLFPYPILTQYLCVNKIPRQRSIDIVFKLRIQRGVGKTTLQKKEVSFGPGHGNIQQVPALF